MTANQAGRAMVAAALAGDSTISSKVSTRIYRDQAPQRAAMPHLIYAEMESDEDERSGNGTLAARYVEFEVYCVGSVEGDVCAVGDRIEALLGKATGTQTGWALSCWGLSAVEDAPAIFNGKTYYRAGGLYKVLASPA